MKREKGQNKQENVLTGIPLSYTLSGTPENEVDELMINHFINTLAEVALSIASRSNS